MLRPLWLLGVWCLLAPLAAAEDLAVLTASSEEDAPAQMVGRYLRELAEDAFAQRRAAFEALETPEQQNEWRQRKRERLLMQLGELPEKTPLAARVVGRLEGEDFRVEKLLYESQPQHYVTAVLYLPKREPPFPAVLIPSGHSREGKAAEYNQRAGILLAKHGIAALAYDPIGQGERNQLLDADGAPRFGSTTEHTLVGAGCIPLGRNTATYRIWDGIRSIDYLTSRKDIDPERIGVTGCSGGGTLTSYLMAIDDRVACAAPSCYLTSFERLLDTIGPQDAEQNIAGQIAYGLDHADYVLIRAPRPTLVLAATHDFFDIQGVWDTFRQAKRFYTRFGLPERIALVETDTPHGFPPAHREPMLRWMQRWLQGVDQPSKEPEFAVFTEEQLQCTPHGQTLRLEGARSVIDLNAERDRELEAQRRRIWKPENLPQALAKVRQITGIRPLSDLPELSEQRVGQVEREGYTIDKLILKSESNIVLPALLFRPQQPSDAPRVLYLHGEGKQADAAPGGPIEKLVQQGQTVLAVDLRGSGETAADYQELWGGNWKDIFLAYLLNRPFVTMRAEDTLAAARFLANLHGGDARVPVRLVAIGQAGSPALHAAALEKPLFEHVTLSRSLDSWSQVVGHPAASGQLVNTVHGALRAYDLPDLRATLTKDQLTVTGPNDL